MGFMNYGKQFDSNDRDTLWKLTRHCGIPQNINNLWKATWGHKRSHLDEGKLYLIHLKKEQEYGGGMFCHFLTIDWLMKTTIDWTWNLKNSDTADWWCGLCQQQCSPNPYTHACNNYKYDSHIYTTGSLLVLRSLCNVPKFSSCNLWQETGALIDIYMCVQVVQWK